jgi:hypothetical protein
MQPLDCFVAWGTASRNDKYIKEISNSGYFKVKLVTNMRSFSKKTFLSLIFVFLLLVLLNAQAPLKVAAQQATGSVPTVTSTPLGPYVIVIYDDQINVRAGPNQYDYSVVGTMLPGETAPVLGVSISGSWIQISFPGVEGGVGWVFSTYVKLVSTESLRIIEAPPTPVPLTTATINPTVAASFITPIPPTRIPTFTPPGPLQIPTYVSLETRAAGPVPMGLVIVLLALIGGFGALISFLRGR